MVDTKSVFMRLLTLWKAHNLPATLPSCPSIIKIINVVLWKSIANRIRIHFMAVTGAERGRGAGCRVVARRAEKAVLSGNSWYRQLTWRRLSWLMNCSVLLAFTSIYRVSSINVCALLYCPSTPTTRHNPPSCILHPQPCPSVSHLSQHLVTFYLISFYSLSMWLCVQSTSIVGALMAIHPIQLHDNDIHIMMRLSVPFLWHFRDAIKLFESSVLACPEPSFLQQRWVHKAVGWNAELWVYKYLYKYIFINKTLLRIDWQTVRDVDGTRSSTAAVETIIQWQIPRWRELQLVRLMNMRNQVAFDGSLCGVRS